MRPIIVCFCMLTLGILSCGFMYIVYILFPELQTIYEQHYNIAQIIIIIFSSLTAVLDLIFGYLLGNKFSDYFGLRD